MQGQHIGSRFGDDIDIPELAELFAERGRHRRPETGLLVLAQRKLVLLTIRRAEREFQLVDHELRVVREGDARPHESGFEIPCADRLQSLDIDVARRPRLGGLRRTGDQGACGQQEDAVTDEKNASHCCHRSD